MIYDLKILKKGKKPQGNFNLKNTNCVIAYIL